MPQSQKAATLSSRAGLRLKRHADTPHYRMAAAGQALLTPPAGDL